MYFDQMAQGLRFRLGSSRTRVLATLISALLATRVLAMFILPLTDTTEARYAEIARKMVETGDWITPQFDYGVPFWGKPPLHTWLSALGMEAFGTSPFGARILIFLATLGLLWMVWDFLSREVSRDTAGLACVVLASSGLFFGAAAFVMTDMVMTFGTTLAMVGVWTCTSQAGAATSARLNGHVVFVGLAIGLLAKGPVALVLVAIPLGLWSLNAECRMRLKALPWRSGTLLCIALCLPWYALAEWKTPGFLNYFIIGEHFERFTIPDWQGDLYGGGHERSKGAIWLGWGIAFFPWSLVALCLICVPGKVVRAFRSDGTGVMPYLLVWSLSPLLLFTFSANILAAYVLPGLPAAAALLVIIWKRVWPALHIARSGVAFAGVAATPVILFAAITVAGAVAPLEIGLRTQKPVIDAAAQIDGAAAIHYADQVPFSAQFYTAGGARARNGRTDVSDLLSNGTPDILILRNPRAHSAASGVPDGFHVAGQVGRFVLLTDGQSAGDHQ